MSINHNLAPDITKDMKSWFLFYDPNLKGLNKVEIFNAILDVIINKKDNDNNKIDIHDMYMNIEQLWLIFDSDHSGRITIDEFCTPGLLGESIVAQLQLSDQLKSNIDNNNNNNEDSNIIHPSITIPSNLPSSMDNNTTSNSVTILNDTNGSIQNIIAIFPYISKNVIENTLNKCNGDEELAINMLLMNDSSVNEQLMPFEKPSLNSNNSNNYANTNSNTSNNNNTSNNQYSCGKCTTIFTIQLSSTITTPTKVVSASCPVCNTINHIHLNTNNIISTSTTTTSAATISTHNYNSATAATIIPYIPSYNPTNQIYRPLPGLIAQLVPNSSNEYSYSSSSSSYGTIPIRHGSISTKRALLIGINYRGQHGCELKGCINDVHCIFRLLTITFGWLPCYIRILTEDERNPKNKPTRVNIINSLQWLVKDVMPGDVLFFHYSGHGAQKEDPHGIEEDGMNETILPVDFRSSGMITDDEICSLTIQTLPERVRLTAIMDCCHSGTGLDLPYTWNHHTKSFLEETNPYHTLGDVQLFSGCEDGKTSADACNVAYTNTYGGAMTTAFSEALLMNPCPTYIELLSNILYQLHRKGYKQKPQLSSSQRFDMYRPFLLDDVIPNTNMYIGRTIRKKFKPKRRIGDNDILGIGMAAVGGLFIADMLFR